MGGASPHLVTSECTRQFASFDLEQTAKEHNEGLWDVPPSTQDLTKHRRVESRSVEAQVYAS